MPQVLLTIKGKDEVTAVLQGAGAGVAALGSKMEGLSPHVEKVSEGVGAAAGVLALFTSALPPVATTIAAVGGAASIAGEAAANMGDAWGYSLRTVGEAAAESENVLAAYFAQMPGHAKRLVGLGEESLTLADGLETVAKTASHAGVFLAAWGDKIESVTNFFTNLVHTQMQMQWEQGKMTKGADLLIQATSKLIGVMTYLQANAVKVAPVLAKVGAALKILVLQMKGGGKEGRHLTGVLASLKKAMNPHLADSFKRIGASLKRLAATIKDKAQKALERLKAAIISLKDKGVAALGKLKDAFNTFKDKIEDVFERTKRKFQVWKVSLKRWAEGAVLSFTVVSLAMAGLSPLLDKITAKFELLMPDAAKLEGIKNAFLSIAREGAPALLASLKASSAGMTEQIDLMGAYVDATLLINQQVAERLPEALKYLTKISLATGESMDYLLDSLVRGVGRLSPRILDNLKIQVSLAEATDYATRMFGKEADELSVTEKQVAIMSLTMDKLRSKTASLADATGSLSQMMAEHGVLQAENVKLLSSIFIPVAKSFYAIQIKLAKAFQANISEGGKWYNILRKISAIVSVLIDYVGELIDKFTGVGGEAVDAFADKMFKAAWDAFEWGANIISNLAQGMIRGAATALLSAMNFIESVLAYWLAPGSAPRVAQNLGDWGADAFTAWLRGFTEADFSVLTGVQSPLRGALQNLVALEDMSASEAHDLYRSVSEAMAQALETGDPGAALAALAGVEDYGTELEKLFRHQMAVADATNAVEQAEARLIAARDTEEKMTKQLSKEAREYNRALRAGASKEVLREKLAQLKATYGTLEAAREEAELAEDDKKAAQERLKEQTSLMRIQNSLLQQLIDMGRVVTDISESEGPDWEIDMPDFDPLFGGIDEAFEALKASIRAKFEGLWADLKADWEASGVGNLLNELRERWEESNLKVWLEEFIFDVREEGLWAALRNIWTSKIAPTIQAWLDDRSPALANVWRAFTEEGIKDGSGQVDFGGAIRTLWIEASKKILETLDGTWMGKVWKAFVQGGIEDGSGKVSFRAAVATLWLEGSKAILRRLDGTWLGRVWKAFVQGGIEDGSGAVDFGAALATLWAEVKAGLRILASRIATWVKDKLAGALVGRDLGGESFWVGLGARIINWYARGFTGAFYILRDLLKGIMNGILQMMENAINNAVQGVNNLIRTMNAIPQVRHIDEIAYISIPRLAQGGMITATEQLALMHRNEAVLPLDDPRTIHALSDAFQLAQVNAGAPVTIHNHFGPDSVRSDRDIKAIADAMQRSLELQGVRTRIM